MPDARAPTDPCLADLLGFDVHDDLIRSVITGPTVLPVTAGVFGDWGGGKSSIMKMLQKKLSRRVALTLPLLCSNNMGMEGNYDEKIHKG